MRRLMTIVLFFIGTSLTFAQNQFPNGKLKISDNGHFLQFENGKPFFWLGDTGWEMISHLNKQEISKYLQNRKAKGFNVIQAVIIDDNADPVEPNQYQEPPFVNNDPKYLNTKYFELVDWTLKQAMNKGLFIALLPTWGGNVTKLRGNGKAFFGPSEAYHYGFFLGNRYKDYPNIIWVVGGDQPAFKDKIDWRPVWRMMVKGIKDGGDNTALITYHPAGESSSAQYWKNENLLNFNMMQSGHRTHDLPVWDWIRRDYSITPAIPILDGEPNYEDHPVNWNAENGYFNAYDVRKQLYRSVFSGACGVTYGDHAIWQFYSEREKPVSAPDRTWTEALDRPGAYQAGYLKELILSRPCMDRVPDQQIIKSGQGEKGEYMTAFRNQENTYGMIYLPVGKRIAVSTDWLQGRQVLAWWFNPKTGVAEKIGLFPKTANPLQFDAPSTGIDNDWVLVMDSADKKWPAPGR